MYLFAYWVLLSDTKVSKDVPKQLIVGHFARNHTKMVQSLSNVNRQQITRQLSGKTKPHFLYFFQRLQQRIVMPCIGYYRFVVAQSTCVYKRKQGFFELVDADFVFGGNE